MESPNVVSDSGVMNMECFIRKANHQIQILPSEWGFSIQSYKGEQNRIYLFCSLMFVDLYPNSLFAAFVEVIGGR